jgi:hypothetical protein
MLVKEESEKKKFMKEIEDEMKNYYTLLIDTKMKNPMSEWVQGVTEEIKSLKKNE